jgi:hypothetical protein
MGPRDEADVSDRGAVGERGGGVERVRISAWRATETEIRGVVHLVQHERT